MIRFDFAKAACAIALLLAAGPALADWPNFRGPDFTGAGAPGVLAGYSGTPAKAWETDAGIGVSAAVVVGDKLITMGNKDDHDVVVCLNAGTGEQVWQFKYPNKLTKRQFDGGTAPTPAVDGDMVYVLGESGQVYCLRLADGGEVWSTHANEFGGKLPRWHYSGSPIVVGDKVILNIGGNGNSTLALNKATGDKVWGAGSQGASYGTPSAFEHKGRTFVAVAKQKSYVVLDAATGRQIASIPLSSSYDVNSGTPSFADGKLLITNGYGNGKARLFDLDRGAQQVWENGDFAAKYCSPVIYKGHLYGISGERGGAMTCIRLSDGKTVWQQGRYGNGTLTIVDGHIVAVSESGKLIIAKADPTGFNPTVEMSAVRGRVWVEPVVANGHVYVRNNKGQLAAFKLK